MANITFKLNTGASIPALGLGTWQSPAGEVRKAVAHAIKVGYRHIDAAYVYGNEKEVGEGIAEGIKAAGITRSDLFVTTKLWCTYHAKVEEGLNKSLEALGLDYVDLYLIHWPVPMNPNGDHDLFPKLANGARDLLHGHSHVETYKSLEKLLPSGKVKAIGVSNYSQRFLDELLPNVSVVPAVNQVENHPLLPQHELVDFCKSKGIVITAYSPLGSTGTPLFKDEHIVKLAEKKSVSPGSILLSYHVARGIVVLAKSVTLSRIEENLKIVDLTPEDLKYLNEISKNGVKRHVYPEFGVNLGFPDKQ
ncbi:hypothetical protein DV735_g2281, partial [Chaetothyriales sp. CBS 134920]